MKVVILCGGKGTRLYEETEFKPKPLVEIGYMPILWHIMKIYSAFGYNEFILALGYKGCMIKEYFLNYQELSNDFTLNLRSKHSKIIYYNNSNPEDWNITFVDTGLETQTGARIAKIKDFIGNDDNFFLTYGDGVSDVNIHDLYSFHIAQNKVLTLTGVHPPSPFGIITVENGIVTSFKEKPLLSGLINGGFFVCNKKIFDYLSDHPDCIFEETPMKTLSKEKAIAVFEHNGFWFAIDTQKHVHELNKIYDSGNIPWKIW